MYAKKNKKFQNIERNDFCLLNVTKFFPVVTAVNRSCFIRLHLHVQKSFCRRQSERRQTNQSWEEKKNCVKKLLSEKKTIRKS